MVSRYAEQLRVRRKQSEEHKGSRARPSCRSYVRSFQIMSIVDDDVPNLPIQDCLLYDTSSNRISMWGCWKELDRTCLEGWNHSLWLLGLGYKSPGFGTCRDGDRLLEELSNDSQILKIERVWVSDCGLLNFAIRLT